MMKEKQKILVILFLLPFFVSTASAEEEHASNFIDFLGKSINFIVLFGGLTYILYKPIRSFLEKRAGDIRRSLKEAEDLRREAELKLQESRTRLASLADEIERIKKEAEIEGQREREKALQLTGHEAERIKSFARKEIEMLLQAEIRHLKEYTAEKAVALAEERIKGKLGPEDQSFFIDKSIKRLDRLYEKPNTRKKIHSGVN